MTDRRIVTALPGQGHTATFTEDDGTTSTAPVIGWLVWDDGDVEAITSDGLGFVNYASTGGGVNVLVTAPGEALPVPPTFLHAPPARERLAQLIEGTFTGTDFSRGEAFAAVQKLDRGPRGKPMSRSQFMDALGRLEADCLVVRNEDRRYHWAAA
jgi:hypothetical protein